MERRMEIFCSWRHTKESRRAYSDAKHFDLPDCISASKFFKDMFSFPYGDAISWQRQKGLQKRRSDEIVVPNLPVKSVVLEAEEYMISRDSLKFLDEYIILADYLEMT